MRFLPILLLLVGACGPDDPAPKQEAPPPEDPRLAELLAVLQNGDPRACVDLGELGGERAREALVGILQSPSPEPARDGPMRLYAAVGLTRLADPATAIVLIEALSKVNPNDNIASLASEERNQEYYTVDAQIADALLTLGLWTAEEDLVAQMQRRDRIRVLIDAYAVLRRQTGIDLPYHYNGSYEDRIRQAEAWRAKLRETRAQREKERPFDAGNEQFQKDCRRIVKWLGGKAMNDRLIAHKVLDRVGRYALPFLEEALTSDRGVDQRQAAYMMGRIGHMDAAPALRRALNVKDADARGEVVDALRLVGSKLAFAEVCKAIADEDPEVRAAAARYLGASGNAEANEVLRGAVKAEQRPNARASMLFALLGLGEPGVADDVLEIFVSGDQLEREIAARELARATGRKLAATALDSKEKRSAAAAAFRQG